MTIPDYPAQESLPSIPFEDSNVRVAVRARPLIEKEVVDKCQECVSYSADGREVVLGKDRRFTFDHVFCPTTAQEEVYRVCVKPLVESCVAGYNATVIAYGQTGSGKTHTMGSATNPVSGEEDLGILPRAIRQLYESIEERKHEAQFDVKCCFVEIYNEEIKDLLHPDTPSKSISIREDANGDIILAGVKDEAVFTYEDMMRCLEQGSAFRTTGSTLMNQLSSRSHAIFTMNIEQQSLQTLNGHEIISAKFHLVDLAGSERAKRTGAVGMRFKESVTINCGLLALGNVISALGDERKRGQHVPYRESKLTRILQDSLGGNSKTCMIACISTADVNFEETLNTLKYANRARNIQNKPIINRDAHSVQLNQLRSEVKLLQEELMKARMQGNGDDASPFILKGELPTTELQMLRQKSTKVEQEFLHLKKESEASKVLLKKLESETLQLRAESSDYQLKLEEVCTEMSSLLQVIPQWESNKDVTTAARVYLLEMMKRILCALGRAEMATISPEEAERRLSPVKELQSTDVATETEITPKVDDSADVQLLTKHLETIRCLEEQLAARDRDVQAKTEEIIEAKEDLARDEHIFTEKMKEMQALKKLARDFRKEKEELLQRAEADATNITRLSEEVAAKDNEITDLKALQASSQEATVNSCEEVQANEPLDAQKIEASNENGEVDQKEEVIIEEKTEADSVHKEIETQIVELQAEIKKKEEEAKSVKRELDALDRASAIGRNGKKQLHEELEQHLKKLTFNLKFLKKQRWQLESQQLEQQKVKADEKVQHLQHQVTRMRAQQDSLKKKIKDTTEKFEDRQRRPEQTKEDETGELVKINGHAPDPSEQDERNKIYEQGGETLLTNLEEIFGRLNHQSEVLDQNGNAEEPRDKENEEYKNINDNLRLKLQRVISSWYAEKQAVEQTLQSERLAWEARVNQHEQLERDHKALREELENTRSLMHKAGLGIRLSSRSVREISDGDVDLRTSVSLPPSRGS
ncbi:chromosome-associated kinesin KIF4A isoform X1 [Selaginella moellendorffii]|uniref:chromosome-associated kinesin KIF4A isoform X1 n=1 Tax=Selaginella moellendorffii TaxID=88036 RepID=UPI000D1CB022|nr:chromosome-associated kinesin KIF4A isoform X1 [Selaginella moellendorffii]XP_024518425.1 chromosome-associated kinesin KIF4A isoform X1 [Selaginella moellendorffii]XP_024518426.1 chromosome-associated kinesin KIF4A isoform X1 [Selaginella moellendorffii]XP_024518427.1 chromosome-associated kinesin KIF4A isoform X1 [Selaginella moellendorffii]XP_024518428.1 chromosome-associated kinesin KIF4A isoform X1 [Selaginella moellendorffii]XP_024518429.1 chromosome-associated kinesin KIF4A isoform X|eukprot:XP_024518424.1 chromosome-associated kinesin KIF4A isoform X1 [Selaginella moellendorffii]